MAKISEKNKNILQILLISFLSVVSMSLQLNIPKELDANIQGLYEVVSNITLSMQLDVVQGSVLFIGLILIYRYVPQLDNTKSIFMIIFSIVLSSFWAVSVSYLQVGSLQLLYKTTGQVVKFFLYVTGYSILNYNLLLLFYHKIHSKENNSIYNSFTFKHTFKKYILIISLIWLPTLIISYPAKIYGDTWNQIGQTCGVLIRSTHHPAFGTAIISLFIKIGSMLGKVEYGLFILEIMQMALSALTLAYSLAIMQKKLNAPKWMLIFSLIIFTITTYSESFSVIVKDVPYSISFLLLIIEITLLISDTKSFFKSRVDIIWLCVSIIGIGLFRNNGKYLLLAFSIFLFIFLMKRKIKRYIIYFLIPLVFAIGVDSAIAKIGGFVDGSKMEIFCLPIQQVARIVTYHPNSISDEQKEVLSKVCDYDKLTQSYSPIIADSAKETFIKSNEINQDIKDFLKVWLQLVKQHPVTAVSATINQNIPLVYPFIQNAKIFDGTSVFYYYYDMLMYKPIANKIGINDESYFEQERNTQMSLYELVNKLPGIGLFSQQAIYVLLILVLIVFSIIDKKIYEFWLLAILELIAIGMIIVGPCIQYMPRYAYPIVYSAPIIVSYYYSLLHEENQRKSEISE